MNYSLDIDKFIVGKLPPDTLLVVERDLTGKSNLDKLKPNTDGPVDINRLQEVQELVNFSDFAKTTSELETSSEEIEFSYHGDNNIELDFQLPSLEEQDVKEVKQWNEFAKSDIERSYLDLIA